jgi:dihydropteroate synthase
MFLPLAAASQVWETTRFSLNLSRPLVMGIVNITPDSFSDGGVCASPSAAIEHCERLVSEGADILDLGAESSRPGAAPVSALEEWSRLEPVLAVALSLGVPVSLDTVKPEIMRRGLDLGVDIINDIQALRAPDALRVVAEHPRCGVCLMHMQGQPQTMQDAPAYAQDVLDTVRDFLAERLSALCAAGVQAQRVVLDPGIGFGKTVAHNFRLLERQSDLLALGRPLLVGWSRKSSLGAVTGRDVAQRGPASLAAALAACVQGASVLRVHDVSALVDALKVWNSAGFFPPKNLH